MRVKRSVLVGQPVVVSSTGSSQKTVKVNGPYGRDLYFDIESANAPVPEGSGLEAQYTVTIDRNLMLEGFARNLALVDEVKARGKKLGISPAAVARLVGENLDDLDGLLQELPQHTLDGLALRIYGQPAARAELPPTPATDPAPRVSSWDSLAERHYDRAR